MVIAVFLLVSVVLAMIMMMPSPQVESQRASTLGDIQFPQADEGGVVPLFWGTIRLKAPNTIWYGDFRVVPITQKVSSGLFSSKNVTIGYRYYVGMDLALGLGPNIAMRRIWTGKYVAWQGLVSGETTFTIDQMDLYGGDSQQGGLKGDVTFYGGSFSQSRDPYLATYCDANVPRYGGTCHAVFKNFYIGTTTQLQAFNFELSNLSDTLLPGMGIMPNGLDANPMQIMYDVFTQTWGRLGVDPTLIDVPSWQAAATILYNEGNGMSLKLEAANTGKSVVDEIARQADAMIYQDPETMKVVTKLMRFDYDVDTLPVFDVSIVQKINNFAKTTWDSTFNEARVTFSNRDKDYNDTVASAQDFGNINFQQKVKSTALSFPAITVPLLASQIASRALGIYSVPLYKCDLTCNRMASSLRPGDVFVLDWEPFDLERIVMRVQKVDLGTLDSGIVTLTVIQDKFAANSLVFAPPIQSGWQPIVNTPRAITVRNIIESPLFINAAAGYAIPDNQGALYVLARKPGSLSLTYQDETTVDAFVTTALSLDKASYTPSGRLVANYAATEGGTIRYDTTVGIVIDLLDDTTLLANAASRAATNDGRALIVIGNEILSYTAFVNNLNGTYTLKNISRGFLDTLPSAHVAGDYLFFVPGQNGLTNTLFSDTATVTSRLRDNTTTATLPVASALTNAVTLARRAFRPAAPAYLTLGGLRAPATVGGNTGLVVAWRERNRKSTTISWYDDATVTPEAGTTYTLRYRYAGGAYTTVTGLTSPTYTFTTANLAQTLDVEVWAVRDTLASTISDVVSTTVVPVAGSSIILTHMDGTVGSTTFASAIGANWSVTGDVKVDGTGKFSQSAIFDGSGDWLSVPLSNVQLGAGDFTLECWINTVQTTERYFFDCHVAANNTFQFGMKANVLTWYNSAANAVLLNGTIPVNTGAFVHIAAVRSAGVLKFYVNGVLDGSATLGVNYNYSTGVLALGAQVNSRNGAYDFAGRMDEVRISNVARYTAAFTPSAVPFTS